jgi:tetrahydromethanopterin S-methyltransferase subunit F
VADLRVHAEVLVGMGLMPSLERVLSVVADVREKYKSKIEAARRRKPVQRRQA